MTEQLLMWSAMTFEIQENKEDRERINKIKSWDGYLDTQSRRDNKIDKILK